MNFAIAYIIAIAALVALAIVAWAVYEVVTFASDNPVVIVAMGVAGLFLVIWRFCR